MLAFLELIPQFNKLKRREFWVLRSFRYESNRNSNRNHSFFAQLNVGTLKFSSRLTVLTPCARRNQGLTFRAYGPSSCMQSETWNVISTLLSIADGSRQFTNFSYISIYILAFLGGNQRSDTYFVDFRFKKHELNSYPGSSIRGIP